MAKRDDSRKRERSDNISSTKSVLTYATPPEVSTTELDATSDVGKQASRSLPGNFTAVIYGDWMTGMDQDTFSAKGGVSYPQSGSAVPMFWDN